jgi:hypothetical protein
MAPPFTMQFVELKVKSTSKESCHGEIVKDHGIVHENALGTDRDLETAFAVSGFEGFDEDVNVKPTFGKNR